MGPDQSVKGRRAVRIEVETLLKRRELTLDVSLLAALLGLFEQQADEGGAVRPCFDASFGECGELV